MLSAVENFGPAAAAATHAYAHHHNLSIAAAAAAASTAAAAAIPSQQAALDHHRHMLTHSSLSNAGLLLPSSQLPTLPSSEGTMSISARNLSSATLSSLSNNINNNNLPSGPVSASMSSAEFVRPHPKQPRFSSSSNSTSSTNGITVNSNGGSNGIPLQVRSGKTGCISSNLPSPRSKYSSEQTGPVNLVTSNNNNNNNKIGGSNCSLSPPVKSPALETGIPPLSPSEREREILAGMYAQKLQFSPSVTAEAAAAAAYHQYRLLAANRSIYGDPTLYAHHQLARSQLHPTSYISDQFPAYLHPTPNAFSPPAPATLLGPPPPPTVATTQLGSPHSASNLLNNSHNNSNSSSISTNQLPVMLERHPHPTSLHHGSSHIPQPPPPHLGLDRQHTIQSKDKESRGSNQLNGKANLLPESQAGFKVPSGKEGSMKHRILTRPSTTSSYSEKDLVRRRSPVAAAIYRNSSNNNSPTNFTKGSLIELSTGELRRVEDMRTEDFVQSAERSQHLEMADSTVVKIAISSHTATITFSYNKNRSKVDIDATIEHPFFVYGQGWASCNPDLTLKTFGLKCQRLQVGDVCISLKPRESICPVGSTGHSPTSYAQHSPQQQYKDDFSPQNLSRKAPVPFSSASLSATVPTTATSTAVSSRLSVPIPSHLPPPTSAITHFPSVQSYDMLRTYRTSPPVSHHTSLTTAIAQHHPHHAQRQQKIEGHVVLARNNGDQRPSPSPPSSLNRPPSNQPYYLGAPSEKCNGREVPIIDCNQPGGDEEQDAAMNASAARKRRWSWSNSVNGRDRDGGSGSPAKTVCNS